MVLKYFLLLLLFNTSQLFSQQSLPQSIKLDKIGLEDGLSQSAVNAAVQDRYGFMWFGTQDGLNRYNGYSVTVFKNEPLDPASLSDNTIWSMLTDSRGRLWIGTMLGGLNLYDYENNSFTVYKNNPDDQASISSNYISCILEDSKGNLWIGTDEGGLNLFNESSNNFSRFQYNESKINSINSNDVFCLAEDLNGNIWAGTDRGINKIELINSDLPYEYKITRYKFTTDPSVNNIHSFLCDDAGNIWIGSWGGGLFVFNQEKKSLKNYKYNPVDQNSLSSNNIQAIRRDSSGVIWIATYDAGLLSYNKKQDNFERHSSEALRSLYVDKTGILWIGTFASGVKIFDRYKNNFAHYYDDPFVPGDMNGSVVLAVIEDKDKELWVGTYGTGINRFNSSRKKVINYIHQPGIQSSLSNNKIIALCESSDGKIWVGTEGGGLNYFDKVTGKFFVYKQGTNSISSNEISTIYQDREGLLWVGTNRGTIDIIKDGKVIKHYVNSRTDSSTISGTSVTSIYQDKTGNIWIGTIRGGLHRYNKEKDNFLRCNGLDPKLASTVNVFCITEDEDGIIWFGTVGTGLNRYDPGKNSFRSFTTKEGLSNNNVFGIQSDAAGNLWVSTNNGLCRFNIKTEQFQNYDVRDGLQSNEFNQGAHFKSPAGEMFFGGMNGLNAFYPERISANRYSPPVYITSFTVFDSALQKSLLNDANIELKYSENFFTFEFAALNFTSPEKNMYAYMLEGFDEDWHYVTSSHRYGSYTNLNPGEYTLLVKGSNNDGVWSNTHARINLIIQPPFWMTWWFRGIVIFLALISVGFVIKIYISREVKEKVRIVEQQVAVERERLRIARDMHDELGSRLTEIRWLSEMARKDAKQETSGKLLEISEASKNVISTFSEIVWSVNPQNDYVENLIEYIASYAMEFLKKFDIRCRLYFPGEYPHIFLASEVRHNIFLAVKEILNNAVKHSNTGEIHITSSVEYNYLLISVKDFGKGFARADGGKAGNGLMNMKNRLQSINGSCSIESNFGSGTTVTLKILLAQQS